MRSYIAVSIFALSASVLSAPTPQLGLSNLKDAKDVTGDVLDLGGLPSLLKDGKRDLDVVGGLAKPADGLISSVTKTRVLRHARRQVDVKADIHNDNNKRQLDTLTDLAGVVTDPVDTLTNGLGVDPNLKRGIPVVQDLPVVGGLSSALDDVPVAGSVTQNLSKVTGDLDPVTNAVFNAAEPVTKATELLDTRSPLVDDAEKTVNGVTGDVAGTVGSAEKLIDTRSPLVDDAEKTVNGATSDVAGTVGSAEKLIDTRSPLVNDAKKTVNGATSDVAGTVGSAEKLIDTRSPLVNDAKKTVNGATSDVAGTVGSAKKLIDTRSPLVDDAGKTVGSVTGDVAGAVSGVEKSVLGSDGISL